MKQRVVEGLAAILGSLYEHLEVFDNALLAAEVAKLQRSECVLEVLLALREPFFANVKVFVHEPGS